jgi:hypothetical protein
MTMSVPRDNALENALDDTELTRALLECRSRMEAELARRHDGKSIDGAIDALRGVVTDFAYVARRSGVPPEQALVLFKSTVNAVTAIERWNVIERDALSRDLVQLTIEAYYASPRTADT